MDCAGNNVLSELVVLPAVGAVTVTAACDTIVDRFAALYKYDCADPFGVRLGSDSVLVRSA